MPATNKSSEVIAGYVELATWWLQAAGQQAQAAAAVLAKPTYQPSDLVGLVTEAAKLGNEAAVRVAVECVDAMAIWSSNLGQPTIELSDEYTTTATTGVRSLRRAGPFTTGDATLDPALPFTFLPSALVEGQGTFRISVDSGPVQVAGVYQGSIEVVDAAGVVVDTVAVALKL